MVTVKTMERTGSALQRWKDDLCSDLSAEGSRSCRKRAFSSRMAAAERESHLAEWRTEGQNAV